MGQWVDRDLSGLQTLDYRLGSNLLSLGLVLLIQQLLNGSPVKDSVQREVQPCRHFFHLCCHIQQYQDPE